MAQGTYERKVSVGKMGLAFILTCFIFLIGLLVGYTLTSERTGYLEDIAYKQKLDYESLQLQSLYLDLNSNNASCGVFNNILETSLNDVGNAQAKIDLYIQESNDKNYVDLKRDYLLAQTRYWLLNQRVKSCSSEQVSILYFYSNEECIECGAQGTILTYFKEKFKDKLLIFSLDSDFEAEPMINVLKQTYNITKVPSIIVGDEFMEGLVSKDELLDILCPSYLHPPEICLEN
jgi:hypothetical protein